MQIKQRMIGILPGPVANAGRRTLRRLRLESERRGALQRKVNRAISVPNLPKRSRQPGAVWAVCLAKNEDDIIERSVRHMLSQGVAGIIVVDNGSVDKTRAVLDMVASSDNRVHVGLDAEPGFHQGAKTSYLAHLAWGAGADWVVPFDADELWYADEVTVTERLRQVTADRVWCDFRNAYPLASDGQLDLNSGRPVQVDRNASEWLRIAFRSRRWVWVGEGNHDLRTFGQHPTRCLHMLHFSYRSLEQYSRKVQQGVAALEDAGKDDSIATHWRGWAALTVDERNKRWQEYLAGEGGPIDKFVSNNRVIIQDATRWSTWDPNGVLKD